MYVNILAQKPKKLAKTTEFEFVCELRSVFSPIYDFSQKCRVLT